MKNYAKYPHPHRYDLLRHSNIFLVYDRTIDINIKLYFQLQ